jgi:hypothetical protein
MELVGKLHFAFPGDDVGSRGERLGITFGSARCCAGFGASEAPLHRYRASATFLDRVYRTGPSP